MRANCDDASEWSDKIGDFHTAAVNGVSSTFEDRLGSAPMNNHELMIG